MNDCRCRKVVPYVVVRIAELIMKLGDFSFRD